MSQSRAISQPPPIASPLIAAMNGLGLREKSINSTRPSGRTPVTASPLAARSAASFRSMPAQNARPVPVRIPTRIFGSALKSSIASSSCSMSPPPRALSRSGRFMVKIA